MFPFPRFVIHRFCTFRRSQLAPSGWVFLRNYQQCRHETIDRLIVEAALESHILVAEKAYDEEGRLLPQKFAVYAQSLETAALFFQFYAQVKANNSRETARHLGSNRRVVH